MEAQPVSHFPKKAMLLDVINLLTRRDHNVTSQLLYRIGEASIAVPGKLYPPRLGSSRPAIPSATKFPMVLPSIEAPTRVRLRWEIFPKRYSGLLALRPGANLDARILPPNTVFSAENSSG